MAIPMLPEGRAAAVLGPLQAGVCAALALTLALTGCTADTNARAEPTPTATVSTGDVPDVLATIGDEPITMGDIRAYSGAELDKIETAYQRARSELLEATLQRILRERVLMVEAERRGRTVDQMVLDEAGGSLEPNEVEIAAWYEDNRARVGGRALEQVRTQIADLLRNQHREAAMERLEARLNQEREVKIMLEPFRLTFDNTGAPTAGNPDASVTVVEFSDFQCPFCARFVPTLKQVEEAYGDRVRIVYRQYPITNIHPNAFKAAEASLCAHEQGRFWQLHDQMFQEQDRLSVRELKAMAGRLGLDQSKFDSCLDSGRHAEQIQNDLAEGERAGVTGTPAVFVNGVALGGGAVPYETVARAIDRELARRQ